MATSKPSTIHSARSASDQLELLTRSQRLRMADLSIETDIAVETWVRHAVERFLQDEAPVRRHIAARMMAA